MKMKGSSFFKIDIVDIITGKKAPHLRFIISDPDPDKCVLVVNATTYYDTGREDTSCLLDNGDHKEIKHPSYIAYNWAEGVNITKLLNDKLNRIIDFKDNLSQGVLIRIQEGAKKTRRLRNEFKKYFQYF